MNTVPGLTAGGGLDRPTRHRTEEDTMTATRGTTNRNARGSTTDRAARRAWLVETYRADVDAIVARSGEVIGDWDPTGDERQHCALPVRREPACRCYRCGCLLTVDTVTVDRIIPGCQGGTYRRNNIRPACAACNSETGGKLAHRKAAA